jgi:ferredoxin
VVCESSGYDSQGMATLANTLAASRQVVLLCRPDVPQEIARVQKFLQASRPTSLVILEGRRPGRISEFDRAVESTGIPRFAVQRVPLGVYAGREKDEGLVQTWALAAMVHVAKANSALFAPAAKRTFTQTTGFDRRRLLFSLREGLAEPVEDPVVVSERCAPSHRACRHCSVACGHSAISHAGPLAELAHENCVACGACAAVCPTGALQLPDFSDDEYLALLREFVARSGAFTGSLMVLTCDVGVAALEEEARSGRGLGEGVVVVRVPCVAAVGWVHRIWSASAKVAAISLCPGKLCTSLSDSDLAEESARAAKESLEGGRSILVAHKTLRGEESASDACAEMQVQVTKARAGMLQAPWGQRRDALKTVPVTLLGSSPVRSRSVVTFEVVANDRCVMCGSCSTACPTKALRVESGPAGPELRFFTTACVGCEICYWECQDRALGVSKLFSSAWVDAGRYVVLASDRTELCRGCRREIGPSLGLKKVFDALSKSGNAKLAESVYLCEECKRSRLSSW